MMYSTAIFSTVVLVAVLLTFRDRFGVPIWSSLQTHPINTGAEEIPLGEQFKLCMRNKVYMFTALSSSLVMLQMFVFNNIIG